MEKSKLEAIHSCMNLMANRKYSLEDVLTIERAIVQEYRQRRAAKKLNINTRSSKSVLNKRIAKIANRLAGENKFTENDILIYKRSRLQERCNDHLKLVWKNSAKC